MGSNINVIFSDVVGSVETVGMNFREFVEHEFSGVLEEMWETLNTPTDSAPGRLDLRR